ncbi:MULTISPECIES: magnesium transporter [Salinivibrio]|uniref:Magnesium transporter n=1 Tax=Salinivibrio costicola TaxID=51367 RepID=A0ABX6K8R9_SALCS|nr:MULTISPECIES: magnesium transporter [Salinivibrio]ODP97509.1 magnesium transporter [Salinivibrio sp. DV]PCE65197.1 magnesium transporter [Salinivibrio sp. YCSC6]QCF37759.1 magnesium transporter [Salinivibrio sp. YCSC6]QIR07923.1 magnesium transporter [Salinivibrio costicola]
MQNSDRQEVIEDLLSKVDEGTPEVAQEIEQAHSLDDLALLLESLPVTDRVSFWEQLSPAIQLPVLAEMRADASEAIIRAVDEIRLHDLFAELDADTLLELQDVLTEPLLEEALGRMDTEQKQRYASAQQYADSEVGHWCDHQPLVVPAKTKVNVVLRLLRRVMPKYCDHVFVVDSRGVWVGAVPIHKLFGADGVLKISELVREQFPSLNAREDIYVSADKVASSEEVALPVLDDGGMLIGRLDLGTAYEMQAERAEAQIMATAGLDEDEDLFSPVMKSARNRALWLGINLMTAFLASWFIGLFEATLQQVVALAVLMPVVASMGGIAGSQTLTLIVRGLALGQISKSNLRPLLNKELQVGLLNGVLWAIVIGLIAGYWFNSWGLGMVIGAAIVANIISAALAGIFLPVILDKLKIDPALSGSVILTTVTDIVGFVAFLGLGTLFLL